MGKNQKPAAGMLPQFDPADRPDHPNPNRPGGPPVNTPTTPTPDSPSAEIPPTRWVSWVAFFARGGAVGACEMSGPERITRGEHVTAWQETLARKVCLPSVGITSFTLLRVEDADGQVIG